MNLADELMGIRPLVPLSRGRIVSHDDPPGQSEEQSCISEQVAEWAAQAKRFTSTDVARTLGIPVKTASACLGRLADKGLLEMVGEEPRPNGRPAKIWRVIPPLTRVEAANRKHFG
jgi:predicted ArsR family transcriptional regulator